jgi:hypothetical protein
MIRLRNLLDKGVLLVDCIFDSEFVSGWNETAVQAGFRGQTDSVSERNCFINMAESSNGFLEA